MHRVSDQLRDRYPYPDLPFNVAYDPTKVTRAFGSRSIVKYTELLKMDSLNEENRVRALQELNDLLSNQETKLFAISNDIVYVCVELIEDCSPLVRANAVRVMASLVLIPIENDEISLNIMLESTTKLFSDNHDEVVQAASLLMKNISFSTTGLNLIVSKKDTSLAAATALLTQRPLHALSDATLTLLISILASMTRVDNGATACTELGVTTPILSLLKKYVCYSPHTLLDAIVTLWNIGMHSPARPEAIRLNAVEISLKILTRVLENGINCDSKTNNELIRCLTGAIMALVIEEEAKGRVIEFGVEPLTKCLRNPIPAIKKNATLAVNYACESPLEIHHFVDKLLDETTLLIETFGIKSIPALDKHLRGKDEDAKLSAVKALHELCNMEGGTERVVQTLGMLDNIVQLLNDNHEAVQSAAYEVIRILIKHDASTQSRVGKALQRHNIRDDVQDTILT